jgi:transposase
MHENGLSIRQIAKSCKVGIGTVYLQLREEEYEANLQDKDPRDNPN